MASIIEEIPNLINGVSQQAPSLRFATQAEIQENAHTVIGLGLKKRAPLEYISKLSETTDDLAAVHTIDRDTNEQYKVIITAVQFSGEFSNDFSKGSFRIYDTITGVEQTVTGFDKSSYLNSTNPRDDFVFLTVADTSFIINKSITVLKSSTLGETRNPEGIVFCKAPTNDSDLDIFLDGVGVSGGVASVSSKNVGQGWVDQLNANVPLTYNIFQTISSNVHLSKKDGSNFELQAQGPQANIIGLKDTASDIGVLPITTKDGFIIEIIGDKGTDVDNYWVKHINPNDQGMGKWQETVKPGLANTIDFTTMPVKMIRNPAEMFTSDFGPSFGTPNFSIADIKWDQRLVGDDGSNPDPSFIGQKINDIFFYKNRLGLLSGENIIFSELGSFFNFYFTTLITLPNTDPIDLAAPSNRVSILKSAVPFDGGLLLFSDNSQFSLQESGAEGLTPQSARLDEISQYKHEPTTKPVLVGRKIYYGEDKDGFSSVAEFGIVEDLLEETAEDITAHIPFYINGSIRRIWSDIANGLLFVQSSEKLHELAVYTFLWDRGKKVISSWGKWILPVGETWLEVHVLNSVLYTVIKRSDGTHLCKMTLQSNNLFNQGFDSNIEIGFKPHLEYLSSSIGVYDSICDETRWAVPYVESTIKGIYDFGWDELSGTRVDSLIITSGRIDSWAEQFTDDFSGSGNYTSIAKDGDHTISSISFGRSYKLFYEFTEPSIKNQEGDTVTSVVGDRINIRDFGIRYENTSSFLLRIQAFGRDAMDYEFSGNILGNPSNRFGSGVVFESGTFRKLVMATNEKLRISIIQEDHTPATFLSAFWSGDYFSRARNRRFR